MAEIINFASHQNKRFRLNTDAVASVARYVSLRPAPTEDAKDFVARIVKAYHAELAGSTP